jgi:DNA-binding transcriptional ArsR family regulator
MIDLRRGVDSFKPQAKFFKLLSHPARLGILDVLRDGEQCVCHLEAVLGCRQAYISQHLTTLRNAGVLQDRRDGWNIFYRVAIPQIYDMIDAATALSEPHPELSRRPVQVRALPATCPCPKCNQEHHQDEPALARDAGE